MNYEAVSKHQMEVWIDSLNNATDIIVKIALHWIIVCEKHKKGILYWKHVWEKELLTILWYLRKNIWK